MFQNISNFFHIYKIEGNGERRRGDGTTDPNDRNYEMIKQRRKNVYL